MAFTGGCLCGDIRYQADAEPADTGYCHCRMCQRISGAPLIAWASFPIESFRYLTGTPQVYASSEMAERRFCPRCGSYLDYRLKTAPTTVGINVGTLDEPERAPPAVHIWTASRIPWFEVADELPRIADGGA